MSPLARFDKDRRTGVVETGVVEHHRPGVARPRSMIDIGWTAIARIAGGCVFGRKNAVAPSRDADQRAIADLRGFPERQRRFRTAPPTTGVQLSPRRGHERLRSPDSEPLFGGGEGVEPLSEDRRHIASTCVADSLSFAATHAYRPA